MIKNLQDELYQLESKVKGAKLRVNIRWELKGGKWSKTFFKVLQIQNMQNQTTSELYANDNKSKYSKNCKIILKSSKKIYENLYTKQITSKAATTEFLSKIPSRKKISSEQSNLCEAKLYLDQITKSINSQTNNNSPGNDVPIAEFYKHFSNELAPALLDV